MSSEAQATTITSSRPAQSTTRMKRKQSPLSTSPSKKPTPKKARLTKSSSAQAVPAENNLKDSIRPGLILISIGLNPGIMTGKLGHAYAHPTNRYWPTLHESGITPIRHHPHETIDLMDLYGIGHTNIIPSIASQGAKDLTTQDYLAGAAVLESKVRELRPEAVMIVGKGIWEEWVRYRMGRKYNKKLDGPFEYGWQKEELRIGRTVGEDGEVSWEGARTFVVTTTSGASSSHTKEERLAIWRPMGQWFAPKREEWTQKRAEGAEEWEAGVGIHSPT